MIATMPMPRHRPPQLKSEPPSPPQPLSTTSVPQQRYARGNRPPILANLITKPPLFYQGKGTPRSYSRTRQWNMSFRT